MAVLFPYQDLNAQNAVDSVGVVVVETLSSAVTVGAADGILSENFGSDSMIDSGVSGDLEAINNDEIKNVDNGSAEVANNDQQTTIGEFVNSNSGGSSNSGPKSAAQETDSESGTVTPINDELTAVEEESIDQQSIANDESNNNNLAPSPTHHSLFDHDNSPTSPVSSPTNTAIASPTAPMTTTTTTENNEGQCQSLLHQADIDSNGLLDSSEYMTFLKNLEETQLFLGEEPLLITASVNDQYVDLSYQLKMNFVHLSCVCPPATNDDCCAERSGIYIGDGMEEEMLDRVCVETVSAIMEELGGGEIGS